jgi:hypothetical protein
MTEIQAAIAMLQSGDRLGARMAFETIWRKIKGGVARLERRLADI